MCHSAFLQSTHVLSHPAFFSQHCLSPCFSQFLSHALSHDLLQALSHVPSASQQLSAAFVHPPQSAQSAHSVLSQAALSAPLLHAHETAATIAAAIAKVMKNFFIITTILNSSTLTLFGKNKKLSLKTQYDWDKISIGQVQRPPCHEYVRHLYEIAMRF